MKRNHFLTIIFLVPTLIFGMCTTEEKQEMNGNGYSTNQISDICSETTNKAEHNSLSTAKKSYISVEAAYVGQSGPGFYKYEGSYGTVTEGMSVSNSGFSLGLGYTFDRVGHIKLKYRKLTSTFEDDYGFTFGGDVDISETILSWSASTNPSGDVHFGYGAFIGFGSADFQTAGSTSFFTYGPEIGLIIDVTDSFEIFTDLVWQQRSYSELKGVTFTNFPFGLDIGLRYNFN